MSKCLLSLLIGVLIILLAVTGVVAYRIYMDNKAFAFADYEANRAGVDDKNRIKAYKHYLYRYPSGRHTSDARASIDEIDQRLWEQAATQNTTEAYQHYLSQFNNGTYRDKAMKAILDLTNKAWRDVATEDQFNAFIQKYPYHPVAKVQDFELEILRKAASEFKKGHDVYLYRPIPSEISSLSESPVSVSYIVKPEVNISGDLGVFAITRDGSKSLVLSKNLAAVKGADGHYPQSPELVSRRGEFTLRGSDFPNLVNGLGGQQTVIDHLEVAFFSRDTTGRLSEHSNPVQIQYTK